MRYKENENQIVMDDSFIPSKIISTQVNVRLSSYSNENSDPGKPINACTTIKFEIGKAYVVVYDANYTKTSTPTIDKQSFIGEFRFISTDTQTLVFDASQQFRTKVYDISINAILDAWPAEGMSTI